MCGAPAATEATHCQYCDARLASIACPSCFGMMFAGSKHCPHCGASAARTQRSDAVTPRHCPRCRVHLEEVTLGATVIQECPRCDGLWVETEAFERICADREQQSAVLGARVKSFDGNRGVAVNYVPCPQCGQLMNRLNFARCSGVIIDFCKGHGTWFDHEELRKIVEFIRAGGLEASRRKEREELAEERKRLQEERLKQDARADFMGGSVGRENRRSSVLFMAKDLLDLLVD